MLPSKVGWFSAGCSSFIACLLGKVDEAIYIHVTDQHPDTLRFLMDARPHLPKVTVLQSMDFAGVDDVLSYGYINGPGGAACSLRLKKWVRERWEREHYHAGLTYVWGYDVTEKARAERLAEAMVEADHLFPLIERGLTKEDCHQMCTDMGIERPAMYKLGYPNNNCIGCVKGGMGYWNRIREDFPKVFERRARMERQIGHSCIKGVFLDELEPGRGISNPVVPSCSLACALVEKGGLDAKQSR